MELLPVAKDYDQVSEQVRTFSANALYEMIAGLRPYVAEALGDPAGIHDTEPSRLVAYTQLLKLQSSLIKDLGLLYRVQDRPLPADDAERITPTQLAAILAEQAALHEATLQEAVAAAVAAEREAVASRERLSLQAARTQVLGALARRNGVANGVAR